MIVSVEGERGRSESQLSILPGGDHSWSSGAEPVEPVSLEDSSLEKDNGTIPLSPITVLGFCFSGLLFTGFFAKWASVQFLG